MGSNVALTVTKVVVVAILALSVLYPAQYDQTHEEDKQYSYDNTGTQFTTDVGTKTLFCMFNGSNRWVLADNAEIPISDWHPYSQNKTVNYSIDYSQEYSTQGGVDIQFIQSLSRPTDYVIIVGAQKEQQSGMNPGETPNENMVIPYGITVERCILVLLDDVSVIRPLFLTGETIQNSVYNLVIMGAPTLLEDGVNPLLPYSQTCDFIFRNQIITSSASKLFGTDVTWVNIRGNESQITTEIPAGTYQHVKNAAHVRQLPEESDSYFIVMIGTADGYQNDSVVMLNQNARNIMYYNGADGLVSFIYNVSVGEITTLRTNNSILTFSRPADEGGDITLNVNYIVTSNADAQSYIYGSNEHVNPNDPKYYINNIEYCSGMMLDYISYTIGGTQHSDWHNGWGSIGVKQTDAKPTYSSNNVMTYKINATYNGGQTTETLKLSTSYCLTLKHVEWHGEGRDTLMWTLYEIIIVMAGIQALYSLIVPYARDRYDW